MSNPLEDGFVRDAVGVSKIIRKLLNRAGLVALRFTGDVSLEFQRTPTGDDETVPVSTVLTLRSQWWIGDRGDREQALQGTLPFKAAPEVTRQALRISGIVSLFGGGQEVLDAAVNDDGTLVISTLLGALIVSGREDDFEESWIIDIPTDVPYHDRWSVVCTSTGELFGRPLL